MKHWSGSVARVGFTTVLVAVLLTLTACLSRPAPPSDQQIREQSAQATRDLKEGAKQAAAEAKVAAAQAARGLNDVAQGVHDGMKSNNGEPDSSRVDINSASVARLALLPGISFSKAQDIVKGRPWKSTHSLVSRGLLTREQYADVADQITAK